MLDFKKYSQRWKFDNLTCRLAAAPVSGGEKCDEANLIKWISLEILALVFSLTPGQREKFFRLYFSASDYEELIFRLEIFLVFF